MQAFIQNEVGWGRGVLAIQIISKSQKPIMFFFKLKNQHFLNKRIPLSKMYPELKSTFSKVKSIHVKE